MTSFYNKITSKNLHFNKFTSGIIQVFIQKILLNDLTSLGYKHTQSHFKGQIKETLQGNSLFTKYSKCN